MPQYMVERHLPDFPPDKLPEAAAAAKREAAELSQQGRGVRYVRSTWVPEGEKCYCMFEADSTELVEDVQRRASLPYEVIREAAFLTVEQV